MTQNDEIAVPDCEIVYQQIGATYRYHLRSSVLSDLGESGTLAIDEKLTSYFPDRGKLEIEAKHDGLHIVTYPPSMTISIVRGIVE